ncbi:hypothetical protein BDFB_013331, partial [Asbolus verrucosus]
PNLKKNKFHPYHIPLVQELREGNYERRVHFCNFMQNKVNQNGDFLKFVTFSNAAKFCNNSAVNRYNCHCYAFENPHWIRQTHFRRILSINMWCGIIENCIVGPHLFENNRTGELYLNFL